MSEFKVGDEVWWIEGQFNPRTYFYDFMFIKAIFAEYRNDVVVVHPWFQYKERKDIDKSLFQEVRTNVYKSKGEAIDAMIKRLEELREE